MSKLVVTSWEVRNKLRQLPNSQLLLVGFSKTDDNHNSSNKIKKAQRSRYYF